MKNDVKQDENVEDQHLHFEVGAGETLEREEKNGDVSHLKPGEFKR